MNGRRQREFEAMIERDIVEAGATGERARRYRKAMRGSIAYAFACRDDALEDLWAEIRRLVDPLLTWLARRL